MAKCFLTSDLHGDIGRYTALFATIREERPAALFLAGDLLPSFFAPLVSGAVEDFIADYLAPEVAAVRQELGDAAPQIFLVLGNDDRKLDEEPILEGSEAGLWEYVHLRRADFGMHVVYGYNCIPPSPFRLKDWERYDVSRFVDPGSVSPEEGWHTGSVDRRRIRFQTMQEDLRRLTGEDDLAAAILLTHAPPHRTRLDRAALDGKMVDHAPLDVHVGSIAVRRLIEERQPLLSLHGHVHESARLTGSWRDSIGRTHCLSGAHDGPELALVEFELGDLAAARRRLIPPRRPASPGGEASPDR